jgi:predicted enzyme related to lactoylglutathione lyase
VCSSDCAGVSRTAFADSVTAQPAYCNDTDFLGKIFYNEGKPPSILKGWIALAVKKLEHVGLMVKDIEASIHFYTQVVGMEFKGKLVHTNPAITLAFLGFSGSTETELELIQGYNENLPEEGKVHHIAFAVDNLEEEIERPMGKGWNCSRAPGR